MIIVHYRRTVVGYRTRDVNRSVRVNDGPVSNTTVQVRERHNRRRTQKRYCRNNGNEAGHCIQYPVEVEIGQSEIGAIPRGLVANKRAAAKPCGLGADSLHPA
jgi:hypothetical protein